MRELKLNELNKKRTKILRTACFEIRTKVEERIKNKEQRTKNKEEIEKVIKDFPDGHSAVVPPESIPNSEVKRSNADGSVGFPHVRVGHHQGLIREKPQVRDSLRFFYFGEEEE